MHLVLLAILGLVANSRFPHNARARKSASNCCHASAEYPRLSKILGHLGLPTEAPTPIPAQLAGWGIEIPADWITE